MAPRLLHRVILMKKLPAHSSWTVLSRPRRCVRRSMRGGARAGAPSALRYSLESGSADALYRSFTGIEAAFAWNGAQAATLSSDAERTFPSARSPDWLEHLGLSSYKSQSETVG